MPKKGGPVDERKAEAFDGLSGVFNTLNALLENIVRPTATHLAFKTQINRQQVAKKPADRLTLEKVHAKLHNALFGNPRSGW